MFYFCSDYLINTRDPLVRVDYADVAVDRAPPVIDTEEHCVADQWTPLVRFDLADPVDPLTSHLCHADALIQLLELFLYRKFQKILQTSKIHNFYSVTPNQTNYI